MLSETDDEDAENDALETLFANLGLKPNETDVDRRIAFAQFWKGLAPELRRMCQVLEEENGKIARAARRLGKHPNTVRLWLRKVQRLAARYEL